MKKKHIVLKKKLSLNFFNSLINSDFFILEKSFLSKKNRFLKSNLKLLNVKNESFSLLNYFELIKMLNQVVRIFQFYKNTKSPLLFLDFKNKQFLKIVELYLEQNKNILPVEFKLNSCVSKNVSPFYILLDKMFNNNKNTTKRMIQRNILIFIKINSFFEKNNNNFYKIFNSFNTLKKFIFFLILLKKTYNKQTKKNLCD